MKVISKTTILFLALGSITTAEIRPETPIFVLGQRYITTIKSPEQGEIKLPLLKTTDFCRKYVCRELDPSKDQSPDIKVYEWLEENFTAADEAKYLSTISLAGRYGIIRNVSVYSFRKSSILLTPREIKAFQDLSLVIVGQRLNPSDISRCNTQLSNSMRLVKTSRCTLTKGTLTTFEGKKVLYQLQLTGDKDPTSGRFISGLNAWL